jgi:hypothetical protein
MMGPLEVLTSRCFAYECTILNPSQDPITFRYLLTGKRARECGIIYLEHGTGTFEAGGRRWTVFGSPVSRVL